MRVRGPRGPVRVGGSGAAVLQRVVDALWILFTHYAAHLLYPYTSRLLAAVGVGTVVPGNAQEWTTLNTLASVMAIVTFQVVAEAQSLYRSWQGVPARREVFTTLVAWFTSIPVLLFLAFVTKTSEIYSRAISLIWFFGAACALVAWRLAMRAIVYELRKRGGFTRSVAIAGATEIALSLAKNMVAEPYSGLRLIGFYDDRNSDRRLAVPEEYGGVIGDLNQLVTDAREGKIDIVYISLPMRAESRINALVRKLGDTTVSAYVIADFFVFDLLHAQWTAVGDIPAVSILDTPFHGLGGWVKRLEDLVVGSLILLLIAIPMLIVAIAIKITSPGPVLFRQKRYGLNGKEIRVLKFRSMRVMEDGPTVKQATKDDPRVTPIGKIIRRTSIDELPQFLQVLTGEMSIVGPRPHAVAHNELYRSKIQGYMLRHKVKPGITGWAQVNGWRGETDTYEKMQKRVEHDLDYIRNWNLFLDIRIIWLTVFGSKTNQNVY
ncbi:MAG TPA: undecaprenyl-phosphate glucose phosphotransferase [Polyangiaceae bacterium]|nr:undecaprenyl-phosphate glucose phosphotransferase [Polyangiaceae bacterium]